MFPLLGERARVRANSAIHRVIQQRRKVFGVTSGCQGAAFGRPFFGESENFRAECHSPIDDWRYFSNIL